MAGLDKSLREGNRLPKKSVMTAVGATPETTYTEFAGMIRGAVGPLTGRKITAPVPLRQIQPDLRKALKLRDSTPYTSIIKRAWAK